MTMTDLYEHDIHAWTQQTAELLRQRRFQELDIEHLVEELETMGRRDHQELVSRLKILLGHLLKWQYRPAHRSSSWRGSILEQRLRIRDLLQDAPILARSHAPRLCKYSTALHQRGGSGKMRRIAAENLPPE